MKHCNVKTTNAWINPNSHATTHILESNDMDLMCVVCMPVVKRHKIEIIGLLVHEAVHVWQAYAKSIGEDRPGDEQMAYGIQSISQELIDSYYKLSKKIK